MPIQKWSDSIWVLHLTEEPNMSEDLIALKNEVSGLETMPSLVLDMAGLNSINSSNLSQLLRVRKLTIDREARLMLVSVRDSIWAVFLTTGLDKIFDFAPDLATALAALQIERKR